MIPMCFIPIKSRFSMILYCNYNIVYAISVFKTVKHVSSTYPIRVSNIVNSNDSILRSIKTAKQISDVLKMIRLHNSVMNMQHHLQALNSLFILQKKHR